VSTHWCMSLRIHVSGGGSQADTKLSVQGNRFVMMRNNGCTHMHTSIGKMRTCGLRNSGGTTSQETEHDRMITRRICGAQDCALHACSMFAKDAQKCASHTLPWLGRRPYKAWRT
jgi:hypothetical protein